MQMNDYTFVRQINDRQALLSRNGEFFVASESVPGTVATETLVFPANAEGEITDWMEVDGKRGMTLESFLQKNVIA